MTAYSAKGDHNCSLSTDSIGGHDGHDSNPVVPRTPVSSKVNTSRSTSYTLNGTPPVVTDSPLECQGQILTMARSSGFAKFRLGRLTCVLAIEKDSKRIPQLSCREFWRKIRSNELSRAIKVANTVSQLIPFAKIAIDEKRGDVVATSHFREVDAPLQFLKSCQSIIDAINLFLFEMQDFGRDSKIETTIDWHPTLLQSLENGFHAKQHPLRPNALLATLKRTGYQPTLTKELDIVFDDDHLEYSITLDEGDPSYFQMDCLDFATLATGQHRNLAYRAANEVNQSISSAKILVCAQRKSASATFQSECPAHALNIGTLIQEATTAIRLAVNSFHSSYQILVSQSEFQSILK